MKAKIAIIEDEANLRELLHLNFSEKGYDVHVATTFSEGKAIVTHEKPDVILSDLKLPDGDGSRIIPIAKRVREDCQIIIMTAYATIENANELLKNGAYYYMEKPIKFDKAEALIEKAFEKSKLMRENLNLRAEINRKYKFNKETVGNSEAIKKIQEKVKRFAQSNATILIEGESGTGKELLARSIHYNSLCSSGRFVAVNCGAIPENLLESEFFGYVKGAFTGAAKDTAGLFQEANGGTLFLDEIAELPLSMQVKFLRALQENKIRPIGSTKEIAIDVRIIAASNKHIEDEVKAGNFREDLFYRLNVIPIEMPPLRDRTEDIPFLAGIFLERFASANAKKIEGFSPEAIEKIQTFDFPGNVRQLQNIIERAVIMEETKIIGVSSLPFGVSDSTNKTEDEIQSPVQDAAEQNIERFNESKWKKLMQELHDGKKINLKKEIETAVSASEKQLIEKALEITSNNQTKAAKLLNITLRELRYRLSKHKDN